MDHTEGGDHAKFTWSNSAYAMAANITRSFKLYNWCSRIRGIESGGAVRLDRIGGDDEQPTIPLTEETMAEVTEGDRSGWNELIDPLVENLKPMRFWIAEARFSRRLQRRIESAIMAILYAREDPAGAILPPGLQLQPRWNSSYFPRWAWCFARPI